MAPATLPEPTMRRRGPFRGLLAGLLPQCCLLCGTGADGGIALCGACRGALEAVSHPCTRCAGPLAARSGPVDRRICGACLNRPPAFDSATCALEYAGATAYLVRRFKFSGDLAAGRVLARMMLLRPPASASSVLVPVPLHPRRLRERGFNQAAELASQLGRWLGLPCRHAAIRRHAGAVQSMLADAQARRRNVRKAFEPACDVSGWNVLLVDDVLTTGATLDALARTLKRAGACRADVWCAARTVRR